MRNRDLRTAILPTGMADSDLPACLIFGLAFGTNGGGGVTLTNLFAGWPRDRLAIACGAFPQTDSIVRTHSYYMLGDRELSWRWPLYVFKRGGESRAFSDGADAVTPNPASVIVSGLVPRLLVSAKERILGGDWLLYSANVSSGLRNWIDGLDSQVIYGAVGSLPTLRLLAAVERETNLPLVLHQMDDWPPFLYAKGLLGSFARARVEAEFADLAARARVRMAISDAMASEYQMRYGGTWLVMHNTVDIRKWDDAKPSEEYHSHRFRILYSGRVGWGMQRSLQDVAHAVADLHMSGMNVQLEIRSMTIDGRLASRLANLPGVTVSPPIDQSALPSSFAAADLLLIPYDFEGPDASRGLLSFPTKMLEYMVSGTPILLYAPPGHALCQYARARGCALVVDRRDRELLRASIARLVEDRTVGVNVGTLARQVVAEGPSATDNRRRLRFILADAARGCTSHP